MNLKKYEKIGLVLTFMLLLMAVFVLIAQVPKSDADPRIYNHGKPADQLTIADDDGDAAQVQGGALNTVTVDLDGNIATVTESGNLRTVGTGYGHHKIHEGDSFCIQNTTTIGNGAKALILINTPSVSTGYMHLLTSQRGTGEARYEVWEDTVVSVVGTPLMIGNHNRNFPTDSATEFTHTPTVTDGGTHLVPLDLHFGAGQGGEERVRGVREIVLKPDTLYLINTISEAALNEIQTSFEYYLGDRAGP